MGFLAQFQKAVCIHAFMNILEYSRRMRSSLLQKIYFIENVNRNFKLSDYKYFYGSLIASHA